MDVTVEVGIAIRGAERTSRPFSNGMTAVQRSATFSRTRCRPSAWHSRPTCSDSTSPHTSRLSDDHSDSDRPEFADDVLDTRGFSGARMDVVSVQSLPEPGPDAPSVELRVRSGLTEGSLII